MTDYVRTQILLEKKQRIQLDEIAEKAGVTFSELVRDFLNAQLRIRTYEEMRAAADQLCANYTQDENLMASTALDGEDLSMVRGEVWLINLDPTLGAEIRKTRPVVIVSSDAIGILPLRVVVPLTDWKAPYQQAAWMVKIIPGGNNGLTKDSAADTFQIRSVSTARFVQKMGEITRENLDQIVASIGLVIEYPPLN